jgi:hypothetical protein
LFVADWVGTFFASDLEFSPARHELCGDRIGSVRRIDQGRHIGSQCDGKLVGDPPDLFEAGGFDQPGGNEIVRTQRPMLLHSDRRQAIICRLYAIAITADIGFALALLLDDLGLRLGKEVGVSKLGSDFGQFRVEPADLLP